MPGRTQQQPVESQGGGKEGEGDESHNRCSYVDAEEKEEEEEKMEKALLINSSPGRRKRWKNKSLPVKQRSKVLLPLLPPSSFFPASVVSPLFVLERERQEEVIFQFSFDDIALMLTFKSQIVALMSNVKSKRKLAKIKQIAQGKLSTTSHNVCGDSHTQDP